jgi:hypothetical protein
MKSFIAFITAISFLTSNNIAYGDSPFPKEKISFPPINSPDSEAHIGAAISPLSKGLRAPFTGLLLSPEAIATIITELSSYQSLLEIELAKAKAEYEASLSFSLNKLKIEHETDKEILLSQIKSSDKRIVELGILLQKEIDRRPNVFLWTSLGVLGGVGLTLLTVFAISGASN